LKKVIALIVMALAGGLFVQACAVSSASISDVKTCEELDGDSCGMDQPVISADTPVIYLSGMLNDAPSDTKLVITWRYLTDEQDIDAVTLTTEESGSGPFSSSLQMPANGWPSGDYEVVLDLGTDTSESVHKEFSIS
jgi:hypothetical protein